MSSHPTNPTDTEMTTPPTPPTPPTKAAELAAAALSPILSWFHGERGRKAEFVRRVQEHARPGTVSRNLVESWLHPDPSRRTQPLLPNGLLMFEVARLMEIPPATTTKNKKNKPQ